MKMLDPGSVVRESEFATAANATSVPGWLRNMYNKALNGQLIAWNRPDFIKTAGRLFRSQEKTQGRLVKQYTGIANRAGLDPRNVITETGEFGLSREDELRKRKAELEAKR